MTGMPRMPESMLRRLLFLRIAKGDEEQVREVLSWGGRGDWCSPKHHRPAIVRAVRGFNPDCGVVKALLEHGADPSSTDMLGRTALDHARRRLARFEGKPRIPPRRSPSLTPGGELRLREEEWEFIDEMERTHPGAGEEYLQQRRKVAERVWDPRGELEKIVALLEGLARGQGRK